jgi:polyisoprenoid-binding protein YceI
MTARPERSEPGATSTDRSHASIGGTWTIDPADSIVSYAGRTLRLRTITGRLHCLGVIHLDELPPVGVVRFQQPSGLPLLTMALGPASLQMEEADLNATLYGPDVGAVWRQRWWTLDSQSLEILPSGAWRVMATLTAHRTSGLVELRLEVDPKASGRDWLVLRGRGVLDRWDFATGKWASSLDPTIQLELAVHARRVETRPSTERHEGHSYRHPSVTAQEPVRRGQRAS